MEITRHNNQKHEYLDAKFRRILSSRWFSIFYRMKLSEYKNDMLIIHIKNDDYSIN